MTAGQPTVDLPPARVGVRRRPARESIPLRAWLALAVGLTNPFTIRLVGLMPVSEVILLAAGTIYFLRTVLSHRVDETLVGGRVFRWLMAAQAVALFGYIFSDVWRGSSTSDIARGWARMVFLAFDVVCMAVLFGDVRVFVAYELGVAFSGFHVFVHGALFGDAWKFGYGVPLTVLALLVFPLAGPLAACGGVLAMAAVHWAMDFRSMALICVLLAAVQALTLFPARARRWLVPMGVALGMAALAFRGQIVGEGSERSKRSDAERTAMLSAASEAFYASPFIGQGSWFSNSKVMDRFVEIRAENARAAGVGGFGDDDGETMAIHSQMLVGLAEGGLLGGCFFAAYGVFLLWGLWWVAATRRWDRLTAIYLFLLLSGLLNLCFTPFSGAARVDIAATVGALLMLWRERTEWAVDETVERPAREGEWSRA